MLSVHLHIKPKWFIFAIVMKTSKPMVTIVVPVFNRANIVGHTLASISAQTSRDFCVVLVDNGSTDGCPDVLNRWASEQTFDVKVLSERRPGAASARQTGLETVETPWCMFFDSDDVMKPSHVARALAGVEANPDADIIGWDVEFIQIDGRRSVQPFVSEDMQFRAIFNGSMGTQRYFAKTSLFRAAGGWNRDVGVLDDVELGVRLEAQKPKAVKLTGKPTVEIRMGTDSLTCGEQASNIEELDRALTRIEATLGPSKSPWLELKRVIVAAHSPKDEGDALLRSIAERDRRHSLLYRFAYVYTRHGGRGIARILRPLL